MPRSLMLLDTASLYYRAFHALPSSLRAPDGTSVNAVRGTLDAVATLSARFSPDQIVAGWDEQWRPAWRVALVPDYKAHRVRAGSRNEEDTPADLIPQEPLVREALELLGVTVVGAEDAEADDVLGTLCRQGPARTLVVTGDRDLFQLVDDVAGVQVVYTGAGMSKVQLADEAWVRDRYGVDPHRYVDASVLRGDPSDGLPGVPGVGEKTAATLVTRFGDLAGIMAASRDPQATLSPRVRAALGDHDAYIAAARQVVAVTRDLPVSLPAPRDPDWTAFATFAQRWGLGQSAGRVREAWTAHGD